MALWCGEPSSLVHTSGGSHDKEKTRTQKSLVRNETACYKLRAGEGLGQNPRKADPGSRVHTIVGPLQSTLELSIALTYGPAL